MSATQPKIDSKLPPVDKTGVANGKGQFRMSDQGRPGAEHRVGLPLVSIDDDGINSQRSVITPSVSRDREAPRLSTMILKLRRAKLADMLDEILAFLLAHESSFITGLLAVTEITHCFEGKLVFEGESELLKAMVGRLEASDRFHDIKGHGPRGAELSPIDERIFSDFSLHLPAKAIDGLKPLEEKPTESSSDFDRDDDKNSRLEVKVHRSPSASPASSGTERQLSPLGSFRKLKTLWANENKFVFKVNDVSDNSSHILKETTCLQVDEKKSIFKEFNMISNIHSNGKVPGIVQPPVMYEEDVRASMLYKMYKMDLFNFIGTYCEKCSVLGVPEAMAKVWLAQLLSSLKALVKNRIVHRDIKPENILLDENSNIVITDFELAVHFPTPDSIPSANDIEIVGTPLYIPPEIGRKVSIDIGRNDIWSVGVIAWELVCDSNPWELDVDRTSQVNILEVTNATIKPQQKPEHMSSTYYDFICGLVCPLDRRMTIEEAMEHSIFEGIDFDDIDSLFPTEMPHPDLQGNLEHLNRHGLKGALSSTTTTANKNAVSNSRLQCNNRSIQRAKIVPVSSSFSSSTTKSPSPPTRLSNTSVNPGTYTPTPTPTPKASSSSEREESEEIRVRRNLEIFAAFQARQKSRVHVNHEKIDRLERKSSPDSKKKKSIFQSFRVPHW